MLCNVALSPIPELKRIWGVFMDPAERIISFRASTENNGPDRQSKKKVFNYCSLKVQGRIIPFLFKRYSTLRISGGCLEEL